MIIAKIDDDKFIDLVFAAPVIAFQKVEFGYAIAAHDEAYYAPMDHPGGGNLPLEFGDRLGHAFIRRASTPALRTLRPTAKPIPTEAIIAYVRAGNASGPEPMDWYAKAAGDHPAVIEFNCQVVIQAIEEFERPDLHEAMKPAKRDMMSDALDLVIEHAEAAREYCEVGKDAEPALIKMHVLQATQALKTTLEMFLKP